MGFFSELKSDLSQAVNTILPEEEGQEAKSKSGQSGSQKVSLNEMLDHLDEIKLDDIKLDESLLDDVVPDREEPVIPEVEPPKDLNEPTPDLAEAELAKAVEAIQANEQAMAEAEAAAADILTEAPVPWHVNEPAETAPVAEEETNDSANLEALEAISLSKVEEQMQFEAEYEAERQSRKQKKQNKNIGGIGIMDIQQQTPTDETGSITEGMTINGDLTTTGSLDLVGKIIGNVACLGKLNITGEIVGDSKAAEVYAEAARITGEVNSQGSVKVGQSTVVIGNIFATSAVIAGAVKGDIDVHGPVVLDTTAIVMGNIKSQSVQINNGAVIEGMCSQSYAEVNPSAFFDGLKNSKN